MLMRILSRTGSAGLTLVWPISGVVSRSWLCVCTSPDSPKVHALPSLQHKNRLQCPTPYQQTAYTPDKVRPNSLLSLLGGILYLGGNKVTSSHHRHVIQLSPQRHFARITHTMYVCATYYTYIYCT
jgi:hypothetical protein